MIMYLYFFISHANSKAFKYALSLIRQFNCEIIRTNQKVNARTLKADILTPASRDPCLLLCTEQAGEREAGSGPGFSLFKKRWTSSLTLPGCSPSAHPRRWGVPRDAIRGSEMGEFLPRHLAADAPGGFREARYVTTDAPRGFAIGSPLPLGRPRDAIRDSEMGEFLPR